MTTPSVLISGGMAAGGVQTHLSFLCAMLRDAGARVTIAATATNWPSDAVDDLRDRGVTVVVSPFGFGHGAAISKAIAFGTWPMRLRRDYDVLYCIGEGRMHLWAARFLRRNAWRLYHEIAEAPRAGGVVAQVIAAMDGLIVHSDPVWDLMTHAWPDTPARVIPFLTSRGTVERPVRRARRPDATDRLRVAYLGRIVEHKRAGRLATEWDAVSAGLPFATATLDLYGDDHDTVTIPRLRQEVAVLGLSDRVRFRGPYRHEDLPTILARTDLVVLPSTHEGLPLVLVEAMHHGVPIVSTSAGGIASLGIDNPDVRITPGTDWDPFIAGVREMAALLKHNAVDPVRLHDWTEARFGYTSVARQWQDALLSPDRFFDDEQVARSRHPV